MIVLTHQFWVLFSRTGSDSTGLALTIRASSKLTKPDGLCLKRTGSHSTGLALTQQDQLWLKSDSQGGIFLKKTGPKSTGLALTQLNRTSSELKELAITQQELLTLVNPHEWFCLSSTGSDSTVLPLSQQYLHWINQTGFTQQDWLWLNSRAYSTGLARRH